MPDSPDIRGIRRARTLERLTLWLGGRAGPGAGLVVVGGSRVTVARVLDVEDEVVAAVLAVRRATASPQHAGWLPHVTLARRLDRADVQRAVDVLGHDDVELRFTGLRRWDPDLRETRTLGCHGKWSS